MKAGWMGGHSPGGAGPFESEGPAEEEGDADACEECLASAAFDDSPIRSCPFCGMCQHNCPCPPEAQP
jgi:hypothetical protein